MGKQTIAVGFDGALHSYVTPWERADIIPDAPVPGAIAWLIEMQDHFHVIIFTPRAATEEGRVAVLRWLNDWGVTQACELLAVPPAFIYLDPRAWRFVGKFPSMGRVFQAKPWKVGAAIFDPLAELLGVTAKYRKVLWLGHGHAGLYGDDGEMSCGHGHGTRNIPLDFKNDELSVIESCLQEDRLKFLGLPT